MNCGNHALELRSGAETMRSNDAESRRQKPSAKSTLWRSTLGLDVK